MKTVKTISLGAGVQSSTLFLMSCLGEIPKADLAIFADTKGEPPDVYEQLAFLKEMGARYGIPIRVAAQGDLLEDLMRFVEGKSKRATMIPLYCKHPETGEPKGLLMRQCTRDYKIYAIRRELKKYRREIKKKEDRRLAKCEMWLGISTDEADRMDASHVQYIENRYPLIEAEMSREDCINWMREKGFREAPRSACFYCPFHSHDEWLRIKGLFPDFFEKACQIDEKLRRLPNVKNDLYLHRARVPLREAVFLEPDDHSVDGFGNECKGVCGV